MTEFKIVDSVMGSGKTTAVIEQLFKVDGFSDRGIFAGHKIMIVTPYLSEIDRYIHPKEREWTNKRFFVQPMAKDDDGKLGNLKEQLRKGMNVVLSHALFQRFDQEIKDLLRGQDYLLIVDEVPDIIAPYPIDQCDLQDLFALNRISVGDHGVVNWTGDPNYAGRDSELKKNCELGRLVYSEDLKVLYQIYPFDIFLSFQEVWILTYLFEGQLAYYYFKYFGFEYSKYAPLDVWSGDWAPMEIVGANLAKEWNVSRDFSGLIHICDNAVMNKLGDREHSLSSAWYTTHSRNSNEMTQLRRNMNNFFRNICHAKSEDCMWTVIQRFKPKLVGKGYTNGFLPINARATNEYRNRTAVAYMANRYINPFITNFFESAGIEVDQDAYALSEMLQFIWRSAVRDGKEINLYIPSKRMRELLQKWLAGEYLITTSEEYKQKQIADKEEQKKKPRKKRGWHIDD